VPTQGRVPAARGCIHHSAGHVAQLVLMLPDTSVRHSYLAYLQATVAQVVADARTILDHITQNDIRGSVCPDTSVPAPAPDYMRAAFLKEPEPYCDSIFDQTSGVDYGMGAWPLWRPAEAVEAASEPGLQGAPSVPRRRSKSVRITFATATDVWSSRSSRNGTSKPHPFTALSKVDPGSHTRTWRGAPW